MPLIELKCTECGYEFEELTKLGEYPPCPKCGRKTEQKYNGKMWVNGQKSPKCSGNCATCKGCK